MYLGTILNVMMVSIKNGNRQGDGNVFTDKICGEKLAIFDVRENEKFYTSMTSVLAL